MNKVLCKIKQRKEWIMAGAFGIYSTILFALVYHVAYDRGHYDAIEDIVVKAPDGSVINF